MTGFAPRKAAFDLPPGVIYMDGNSLGPLPKTALARAQKVIADEWGAMLITAWNRAGWMAQPARVGDRVARLIGAAAGSVILGDTLSIKVYQALSSALDLRPGRRVVLSDSGNFPSDLYMAEGLLKTLGDVYELRVVPPERVEAALDDSVAVMMLTQVDYGTGRMHDMTRLTAKAHKVGAVAVWDLAHSAGAVPVDLGACRAEFAVGCTYKFLNGGPGAPAFIYVRPDLADTVRPALAGWLGHAAPFAFERGYRPGDGIARMRVGTPSVIQMSILETALEIWDGIDLTALRARAIELSERFIAGVEGACPGLVLASPRAASERGSHVSFRFAQGYPVMQALIARGVIGDFRAPDILRFGITPLYLDEDDIDRAVETLAEIIASRGWDRPEFHTRAAVT